ncbi:MAG: porin [Alphaproteobacteria bacterium]|nr:porin [Alphaproteobacteria bacterium]
MRKFLLATTALVGIAAAGSAHAATSPLTVNVGGSVDFLAGNYAASNQGQTTFIGRQSTNRDFESIYNLNFSILGKANNGVEYGGLVNLTNGADAQNLFEGNSTTPFLNAGYVWMSGAFGKVMLGDSHGATDIAVNAPTVGEGQVTGRFIDFLDTTTFAKNFVLGVDGLDHSTNVTYYTPKVGNENNKVQLGVSYIPQFYNSGASVVSYNGTNGLSGTNNLISAYHDVVKGVLNYQGNMDKVALGASAQIISGSGGSGSGVTIGGTPVSNAASAWTAFAPNGNVQSFTSWGVGAQAALDGFTVGATYLDQGRYNAVVGQDQSQHQYSAGLKYEFNKVGVGVSYLGGEGYSNILSTGNAAGTSVSSANYVKDFNSYGAGGSYTWAPGLTSNLDGVYFDQKTDSGADNEGYVLLVSQKLAF